jgi:hypothetical protein
MFSVPEMKNTNSASEIEASLWDWQKLDLIDPIE